MHGQDKLVENIDWQHPTLSYMSCIGLSKQHTATSIQAKQASIGSGRRSMSEAEHRIVLRYVLIEDIDLPARSLTTAYNH